MVHEKGTIEKGDEEMLRNGQIRKHGGIMGRERGSKGPSLTSEKVKGMARDLFFQSCKTDVSQRSLKMNFVLSLAGRNLNICFSVISKQGR